MGGVAVVMLILFAFAFLYLGSGVLLIIYHGFTDSSPKWRVFYHHPDHIGKNAVMVDGVPYMQSVLMTKSCALNYLGIFGDAKFIRKEKGFFKVGSVIKKGTREYSVTSFLAQQY